MIFSKTLFLHFSTNKIDLIGASLINQTFLSVHALIVGLYKN